MLSIVAFTTKVFPFYVLHHGFRIVLVKKARHLTYHLERNKNRKVPVRYDKTHTAADCRLGSVDCGLRTGYKTRTEVYDADKA